MSGIYDPEIQKKLMRASKRKVLEDLEGDGLLRSGQLITQYTLFSLKNFGFS